MLKLGKNILFIAVCVVTMAASCSPDTDYLVTIKTPHGDMKAILYDETPLHKANFVKLAEEGYYDSLLFHRVIKDFMIQGGDPNSKNAPAGTPLGSGGLNETIPAEFQKHLIHEKGALSAARQGDNMNPKKESSGSQFYVVQGKVWSETELTIDMNKLGMAARQMISLPQYDSIKKVLLAVYDNEGPDGYGKKLLEIKDYVSKTMNINADKDFPVERVTTYTTIGGAPHLDDEYTVFGKVIDGLDVIDKIAEQPIGRGDRPIDNITMVVSVEELKRKEITKRYGYVYPIKETE